MAANSIDGQLCSGPMTIEPAPASTPEEPAHCANCGVPLHGHFCYACGQPIKGLIRHLPGVLADFFDTVLNLDSRLFRTLAPLFFRPGFLTLEYFAGRRVRYVTPLRLFFFLCVVSFFAAQVYLEASTLGNQIVIDDERSDSIAGAQSPAEVQARLDKALAALEAKRHRNGAVAGAVQPALELGRERLRSEAERRLAYLKEAEEARRAGREPPRDPDAPSVSFNGRPWDPRDNPVHLDWLPEAGNAKLNELAGHMTENLRRARQEPRRLVAGLFAVLPETLFVLMPLFAVLLKFFYLFKRRLYMEHLMVALHSHAFIFMAMLVIALAGLTQVWTHDVAPWTSRPLGLVMNLTGVWIPLYLLIMQKRVYRQGWLMTLLKFGMIGISYVMLIALGLAIAFVVSLATTG